MRNYEFYHVKNPLGALSVSPNCIFLQLLLMKRKHLALMVKALRFRLVAAINVQISLTVMLSMLKCVRNQRVVGTRYLDFKMKLLLCHYL